VRISEEEEDHLWAALTSFARFSAVFAAKPVQSRADDTGMNKLNARLLPVAVVVTGFLATFGGYFTTR
jgi:hypothetical protein